MIEWLAVGKPNTLRFSCHMKHTEPFARGGALRSLFITHSWLAWKAHINCVVQLSFSFPLQMTVVISVHRTSMMSVCIRAISLYKTIWKLNSISVWIIRLLFFFHSLSFPKINAPFIMIIYSVVYVILLKNPLYLDLIININLCFQHFSNSFALIKGRL